MSARDFESQLNKAFRFSKDRIPRALSDKSLKSTFMHIGVRAGGAGGGGGAAAPPNFGQLRFFGQQKKFGQSQF